MMNPLESIPLLRKKGDKISQQLEFLPLEDLRLVVALYKKMKVALDGERLAQWTLDEVYVPAIQKYNKVLGSVAPWLLAVPLAKRVTNECVDLYVRTRVTSGASEATVHKDLQTLLAAFQALDTTLDLTALRAKQRAMYVRRQPRREPRFELRWSREEFPKRFPKLVALLKGAAQRHDAYLDQLDGDSVRLHSDEIRTFADALHRCKPMLVIDDPSMFTRNNVIDCLGMVKQRGLAEAGVLKRWRNAFRRIGPPRAYDWMGDLIRDCQPSPRSKSDKSTAADQVNPEIDELLTRLFDDDNFPAVLRGWTAWSAETKRNVRKAYTICTGVLTKVAPELMTAPFACFTPYSIDLISMELVKTCSVQTMKQYYRDLKILLDRADSDVDHAWLLAKASSLKKRRMKEKDANYVPVLNLVQHALAVLDDCLTRLEILGDSGVGNKRRVAQRYRDALLLLFLALTPLRGKALASLRIGTTFKIDPAGYKLGVRAKNARLDMRRIPKPVSFYLAIFLRDVRALIDPTAGVYENGLKLIGTVDKNPWLWPSERGGGISLDYLQSITPKLSGEFTPVRITTHYVRKLAATDASLQVDASLPVRLLHHLNSATTETVYILTAFPAAQEKLAELVGRALAASSAKRSAVV